MIVVSYRATTEDRQGALDAGASIYLTKTECKDSTLSNSVVQMIGEP